MKHPMAPSALDRLREAFRPPPSFGTAAEPPPRARPDALDQADPRPAEDPWNEGAADGVWAADARRGRRLRVDPDVPGLRVLTLVGLLAAVLAGVYLWSSRPAAQPAPRAIVRPAAAPAPATPSTSTPSPTTTVTVDVAGKVRHPGVVTLTTGARVIDAIKAAGGLRPGAKTENLNLARRVTDGEQILVGITATPAPPANPPESPGASPQGTPIDLNTATATELDQLPGVGPVLAQRIVDYRTQHGGFHSVDELRQVSGIGDAKFTDLKDLVRV
jgi:competence protein ComEA